MDLSFLLVLATYNLFTSTEIAMILSCMGISFYMTSSRVDEILRDFCQEGNWKRKRKAEKGDARHCNRYIVQAS